MKIGIKLKTIIPIAAILVITMSGLAVYNYFSQVNLLNKEDEEALRGIIYSAQGIIDGRLKQYQAMAALVADMPSVSQTFAKGDRKKLIAELNGAFMELKKDFGVAQFQFHTPPATSFLRLHQLEKFGDDLTTFRATVVYTNTKKTGTRGLEVGRGGLGLRAVMPVFTKSRHVGSVEFGGDVAPAIDEAKTVFDVDVALLLALEAESTSWPEWHKQTKPIGNHIIFYSTKPYLTQGIVTPALLTQAKSSQKQVYITEGAYNGRDYSVALSPAKDYSGKSIGYLAVFKDRTPVVTKMKRTLAINIIVYLSILGLISWAIDLILRRAVIEPVITLTNAADDVSMGKLSEKIEIKTNDEIEALAKSVERMRISMKKLME